MKVRKVESVSQYYGKKSLLDDSTETKKIKSERHQSKEEPDTTRIEFLTPKTNSGEVTSERNDLSELISSSPIVSRASRVMSGNLTAEDFFTKIAKMGKDDEDNFLPHATPNQIPLKTSNKGKKNTKKS